MKLSVSAYRAHAAAHKKILSSYQLNYGSTSVAAPPSTSPCQTSSTGVGVPGGSGSQQMQTSIRDTYHNEEDEHGGHGGDSQTDDLDDDEDSTERRPPRQRHRQSCGGGSTSEREPMMGQVDDRGGGGGGGTHHQHRVTYGDGVQAGSGYRKQSNHGATGSAPVGSGNLLTVQSPMSPPSLGTSREEEDEDSSNTDCRSPGQRTKSNQRWMKLRTTVQLSSAISTIQKKPPLKREDSFLKRFSTRQTPDAQETVEDTGSEGAGETQQTPRRRRRVIKHPRSVVNPDENFYFYWLLVQTTCVLYNLWTLIVRQSFPELQNLATTFWSTCDWISDVAFFLDIVVQLRTGYLEQGLMVYDSKKLAGHYLHSRAFLLDLCALCPLDLLQIRFGPQPMLRFPRFLKVYRAVTYYYMVESRTVWPNLWRVLNLIHILLILAHWFGCFYFLLSEAEGFQGDWVYPHRPGDYATLSRKYLGSLYWSTLTLTTIGDLPTPETNAEKSMTPDGPKSLPRRGLKSRLLQFNSSNGYIFTIVSYLIGVFIFATIVGQVGNVITNRNANRLEFERLLDGAKTYMRHHKVPGGMKRRVLRWYDYSWSRGRIQGGGDINTALGLLPDKLKTELALHVNLSVLKKVTIFQECQPEFLHDLVLKMKAYIFTPGDTICRKGEVAREMFIIADGILEVLSETGRVLTTMKAGDFFGEIGILCLDGLNKRTADVRSVGYSELFSLSREDVLAAMKDYPEAQEILQNLGRKRLMEVKCSNAQYAARKAASASGHKASGRWHLPGTGGGGGGGNAGGGGGGGGDNGSTDSDANTPRRIVDKIKCEAKGLRKVLRKSRTARRSGDSIELQPLHSGGGGGGIGGSTTSKGVLRRMSRVRSDEFGGQDESAGGGGAPVSEPPAVSSPLGAGLPLLSRLRLLKEKQEREENQSSSSALPLSPKPQETTQQEPEVIGAGLPLLQRLLLLKAKEAREAKEAAAKEASLAAQASKEASLSPTPVTPKIIEEETPEPPVPTSTTNGLGTPLIPLAPVSMKIKPWTKLKKAAILNENITPITTVNNNLIPTSDPSKVTPSLSLVPDIISDNTSALDKREKSVSDVVLGSESDVSTFQHKHKSSSVTFSGASASGVNVDASSSLTRKRKPCMLHIRTKSYASIDDLSPEYGGLPFVKKLKILNERQKLAELESVVQKRSASLDCPEMDNVSLLQDTLTRSHSEACAMQCRGTLCVPLDMNPPLSPESNETLERRTLKSILKKLSEDNQTPDPPELRRLMRAPTIEGYAARHSKLAKSVTFNRDTLQSPPSSAILPGDLKPLALFPLPSRTQSDSATQTDSEDFVEQWLAANKSMNQVKLLRSDFNNAKSIFSTDATVPGPLDEVVVGGIKQVIQCHLQEMQVKFQALEQEVRRRDEIISQLQSRIQELERLSNVNGLSSANNALVPIGSSVFSESTDSQHVILDLDSDDGSTTRSDYENAH